MSKIKCILVLAALVVLLPSELAGHNCSGESDCLDTAGYNALLSSIAALLALIAALFGDIARRNAPIEAAQPPVEVPAAPLPAEEEEEEKEPRIIAMRFLPVDPDTGEVGEAERVPRLDVDYIVAVEYDREPEEDETAVDLSTPRGTLNLRVYRSPDSRTEFRSAVRDVFRLASE